MCDHELEWDSGDERALKLIKEKRLKALDRKDLNEVERLGGIVERMIKRKESWTLKTKLNKVIRVKEKVKVEKKPPKIDYGSDKFLYIRHMLDKLNYRYSKETLSRKELKQNKNILNALLSDFRSEKAFEVALFSGDFKESELDYKSTRLIIELRTFYKRYKELKYKHLLQYMVYGEFHHEVCQIVSFWHPKLMDKSTKPTSVIRVTNTFEARGRRSKAIHKAIRALDTGFIPSPKSRTKLKILGQITLPECFHGSMIKDEVLMIQTKKRFKDKVMRNMNTFKYMVKDTFVNQCIKRLKRGHLFVNVGSKESIHTEVVGDKEISHSFWDFEKRQLLDRDSAANMGILRSYSFKEFASEFYDKFSSWKQKGRQKRQTEIMSDRLRKSSKSDISRQHLLSELNQLSGKEILLDDEANKRAYLTILNKLLRNKKYCELENQPKDEIERQVRKHLLKDFVKDFEKAKKSYKCYLKDLK